MYKFTYTMMLAIALIMLGASRYAAAQEELLWDKTRFELGVEEIVNAIFTPGDTTLLLTDANLKVTEVDVLTGEVLRELPHVSGAAAFSADGQYLYTTDYHKLKWPSGEYIASFPDVKYHYGLGYDYNKAGYNLKSETLVYIKRNHDRLPSAWKKDITVYDMGSLELIDSLGFPYHYNHDLRFYKGSKYFAVEGYQILNWEKPDGDVSYTYYGDLETLDTVPATHPILPILLASGPKVVSPDGIRICAVLGPEYVGVYDNTTFENILYLELENETDRRISSLAISPDSKYVAGANRTGSETGNIHIWDIKTGKVLYRYNNIENKTYILSLTYSSDGKYLLSYGKNSISVFRSIISSAPVGRVDSEKTLYPNPTTGEITIDGSYLEPGHLLLELMNLSGTRIKLLHDGYYAGGTMSLDISTVPAGTYFIRATQGNGSHSFKLMKER